MQMNLSNLVDLALGTPDNLNSDMLHTLLHVIIKKLNIADSCIELSEEPAEKAKILLKNLPQEPAICFREYQLKADGGKIRKKSYHVVGARRSLIHINKKWPKNSPQNAGITNKSNHFEFHSNSLRFDKISKIEERLTAIENEYELKSRYKIEEIDSNELDEEWSLNSEIKWLKKKLLELSDSLKLHSNCLKKVKCEEIPKILNSQNDFADTFRNKCAMMVTITEQIKSQSNADIETLNQIRELQKQMLCIGEKIRNLESNFESHLKKLDSEISSIKNLLGNKNIGKIMVQSNGIINAQSLQKSAYPDETQGQLKVSDSSENYHKLKTWSSSKIIDIQKQVSSHSICMHKFVRDLSSKIDRSEFEIYRGELKDTIDVVMQLKRDIGNLPTAAGCTIPLMKNMNCISCQTSANMTITTTVPKKFGHDRVDFENFCNDYQNRKTTVKIIKRPNTSRMKYKRLKTPYKCSTPLVYKNRYRKNCYY